MATSSTIASLQARQDGLVTLTQAVAAGMSPRAVQYRVRTDEWRRAAPRVYLSAGHAVTDRTRVRAAGLWVGERGVVSGPAAAYWHGLLPAPPREVEVTIPLRGGLRAHAGVRVRRRDLAPADLVEADGIRTTDVPLTVLETAAARYDGSAFLDRALQRHVRFPRVYRAYCRNLGAAGSTRMGELVIAAADRADSIAERLLTRLLRRADIGGWELGRPFHRWTIDLAFPAQRVAVEVDGWAWHVDAARFRADRMKGNALVRAGWTLLRFTWHDLVDRPDDVVAEIAATLHRAAA